MDPKKRLLRPPSPDAERGWLRCRITMSVTIPMRPAQAKSSVTHS